MLYRFLCFVCVLYRFFMFLRLSKVSYSKTLVFCVFDVFANCFLRCLVCAGDWLVIGIGQLALGIMTSSAGSMGRKQWKRRGKRGGGKSGTRRSDVRLWLAGWSIVDYGLWIMEKT